MQVIKDLLTYRPEAACALTIGKFDGIHLGHRELIGRTIQFARKEREAGRSVLSCVLSFDMAPQMILARRERRTILSEMGVDVLIECSFTPKIITIEAEDFIRDIIAGRLQTRYMIVGENFRFGYGRRGTPEMLRRAGEEQGFLVETAEDVLYENEKVSSSRIREALLSGRMEEANALLGYPYFVTGEIIHGRRIGRTIGVPTANLITPKTKLLPPNGVYFTRCEVGGQCFGGMTNIGTKPTVDGHFVGVETHLYDAGGDMYGDLLKVELHHFSRPEKKFDSLEALKEQIRRDEKEGRAYWAGRELR